MIAVVSAGTSDIPVAGGSCGYSGSYGQRCAAFYDVGVAEFTVLLAKSRSAIKGTRRNRLRRHGRRTPQRSRRPRGRARDCRPYQRRLRTAFKGLAALLGMMNPALRT